MPCVRGADGCEGGRRMSNPTCPYCGKDMEWARSFHSMLLPGQHVQFWWECECGAKSPAREREDEALIAATTRHTEPNRLLTLDEVRRQTGSPVWCEDRNGSGAWALVIACVDKCIDANYGDWEFYCYGWTNDRGWRCWLRQPTYKERASTPWT